MKRISVAALIAILGVILMAAVTQATTLTLQSSHTLTPAVKDTTTNTMLTPTGGTIASGVAGMAYLPFEIPASSSQNGVLSIGTSSSVNSSLTSGTSLTTTSGSVNYLGGSNTFTMAQTYVANAPTPSGGDGYVHQYGGLSVGLSSNVPTYFSLNYNLSAGDNYHVSLVDTYSFLYQLVNSTGNANLFKSTYGQLLLNASINYTGGNYSAYQYIVGASAPDSRTGTPVSNFTLQNNAASATLAFDITAASGGTLSFNGYLIAEDYGHTYTGDNPVPLPPSLILLGSGLVGLLALSRRRKVSKS